jgi:NAD(P)-dependent dehydrogenase (short-subunit alcohol dehydrogenase family)
MPAASTFVMQRARGLEERSQMTRTVAVTGDSGRLGRAVVHALVDDGWESVSFDRVPAPSSPTRFEDAGEGGTHG